MLSHAFPYATRRRHGSPAPPPLAKPASELLAVFLDFLELGIDHVVAACLVLGAAARRRLTATACFLIDPLCETARGFREGARRLVDLLLIVRFHRFLERRDGTLDARLL